MGIRSRITLLAVMVVGLVLVAGAFAFVSLTEDRIEDQIRARAVTRTEAVADLVAAGAVTDPLPGRDLELLAQVVDGGGRVVAADQAIAGIPAFVAVEVAVGEQMELTVDSLFEPFEDEERGFEDEGPYAVVVQGVQLESGSGAVMVAATLEDTSDVRNALIPVLAVGLPLLLAFVGVTTWVVTGRALQPVDDMRTEAMQISATDLHRRLPVPAAEDEIRRLSISLNAMLDRLETASEQQRRFVADASHELKSPLAALRTMVDVALTDPDAHPQALADLGGEVDRMQRLVNDLLYLAASDEAQEGRRRQEVDLDQLAGREAESIAHRTGTPVDTSGLRPVRVIGDPVQLSQLVRNLVENAVRYADSTVWIESSLDRAEAILSVSDDGPGIPLPDRERVFERFVRLDDSRTRATGGAGLGLAVSHTIVAAHGGRLDVVDPRHGGASLEARFPAVDVAEEGTQVGGPGTR